MLPKQLNLIRQENYIELYKQTEKLFLVGDTQFITDLAKSLSFPKWIDSSLILSEHICDIDVKIKGKYNSFPIMAMINFFRRPQDDMIVAVSYPSSMIYHYELYRDGLIKLFPQIKENVRENLKDDLASQFMFKHWCIEDPKNRKSKIKKIIRDYERI